jgi:hypothetical protein
MPQQEKVPFEDLVDSQLTPEDAIRIVEAAYENGYRLLPIAMCIPPEDDSPPIYRLYDTLLQLDTVDDHLKSRIRWVKKVQGEFDRAGGEIETSDLSPMRNRAEEITKAIGSGEEIAQRGLADTVTKLRKLRRTGHFRKEDPEPGILGEGDPNEVTDQMLETTIRMMDEGQKTIFWPQYVRAHLGLSGQDGVSPMGFRETIAEVGRTAWAGAKGAVQGAATGAIAGGRVGGLPGAKVGAAMGAATGFVGGAVGNTIKEMEEDVKKKASK